MYLPDVLLSVRDFFFFLGALTLDSLAMFDVYIFEGEYVHESAGHSPHMYVLYTCLFSFPPITRERLIEEIATVQGVHRILTYFNSCIGIYSIEGT